jgi:hypothetical protein
MSIGGSGKLRQPRRPKLSRATWELLFRMLAPGTSQNPSLLRPAVCYRRHRFATRG